MKIAVIVPAAGRGKRLGSKLSKPFVPVNGTPLLAHTLRSLKASHPFKEIILAVDPSEMRKVGGLLERYRMNGVRLVTGGRTRAESVKKGVEAVSDRWEWVLVHDAARPFVSRDLVRRLVGAAQKTGAAVCGLLATATVRRIDPKKRVALKTEDRDSLVLIQTPQVFRKQLLLDRYRRLGQKALQVTDEAALFDGTNVKVSVIPGDPRNIKITTPEDLELCKFYLKKG